MNDGGKRIGKKERMPCPSLGDLRGNRATAAPQSCSQHSAPGHSCASLADWALSTDWCFQYWVNVKMLGKYLEYLCRSLQLQQSTPDENFTEEHFGFQNFNFFRIN